MKIVWLFVLWVISINLSIAQVGVRGYYQGLKNNTWDRLAADQISDGSFNTWNTSGYGLGVDYWFRLKDYRIEFLPEIGYNSLYRLTGQEESLSWSQYYVRWNTHFYILDFEEDCDCPTFSKQSPWFKKGFFLQAGIGAAWSSYDSFTDINTPHQQLELLVSIGAGLDIGITDLITLTPMVTWTHWLTSEWPELGTHDQTLNLDRTATSAVVPGVRLGFRF